MRTHILFLCLAVCLFNTGDAQERLFLIAGQSNARGRGDSTQSPIPGSYAYEYKHQTHSLKPLKDPAGENVVLFQQAYHGSFLPAFAISYHQATSLPLVLVHTARGGSALHPLADNGFGNWSPSGMLFDDCILKTQRAMQKTRLPLSGIIWCQGENDGGAIAEGFITAQDYLSALEDLINRFRMQFGPVPFYIIETGRQLSRADYDSGFAVVRTVQRQVAANDSLTFIVYDKTAGFDTLGFLKPDGVHYNQAGLNDIGFTAGQIIASLNIPPGLFQPLYPPDSAVLAKYSTYPFRWQIARDVDRVYYHLIIHAPGFDTVIHCHTDTLFNVQLTARFPAPGSYQWQVMATDLLDTIYSLPRMFYLQYDYRKQTLPATLPLPYPVTIDTAGDVHPGATPLTPRKSGQLKEWIKP